MYNSYIDRPAGICFWFASHEVLTYVQQVLIAAWCYVQLSFQFLQFLTAHHLTLDDFEQTIVVAEDHWQVATDIFLRIHAIRVSALKPK